MIRPARRRDGCQMSPRRQIHAARCAPENNTPLGAARDAGYRLPARTSTREMISPEQAYEIAQRLKTAEEAQPNDVLLTPSADEQRRCRAPDENVKRSQESTIPAGRAAHENALSCFVAIGDSRRRPPARLKISDVALRERYAPELPDSRGPASAPRREEGGTAHRRAFKPRWCRRPR